MSKALIIAYVWPEPFSSAAGVRTVQIARDLTALGYAVTIASHAENPLGQAEVVRLNYVSYQLRLNDSSFETWFVTQNFKVVVYDRFISEEQFGARVRAVGSPFEIIDTQDFHSLRLAREAAHKAKKKIIIDPEYFSRELAAVLRVSLSLWITAADQAWFLRVLNSRPGKPMPREKKRFQHVLGEGMVYPLVYSTPKKLPALSGPMRKNFIFIGNFQHAPNLDAALWLVDTLWEKIQNQFPSGEGAALHLVGAYPPKNLHERVRAAKKRGLRIEWVGPVPDLESALLSYRVALYPLRFGAGVKGKVILAWLSATPVITTSVGAEGLSPFYGIVADTENRLVRAAVKLYSDEPARQKIAKESLRFRAQNKKIAIKNLKILKAALTNFSPPPPAQAWLSLVLNREQNRSGLYFSRWIEEKNKSGRPK